MSGKCRTAGYVCGAILVAFGMIAAGAYWALARTPPFYAAAAPLDPQRARQASDEMLAHVTALASDAQRAGKWYALFTCEQINGWLAVDIEENHSRLIPDGVADPRVDVHPRQATIACRLEQGAMSTVLTVACEVFVPEPGIVAVHIKNARAGAIPISISPVVARISDVARRLDLRLSWRQLDGSPVALIELPASGGRDVVYELDAVQLREGAVYLAGRTRRAARSDSPGQEQAPQPSMANRSAENEKTNR